MSGINGPDGMRASPADGPVLAFTTVYKGRSYKLINDVDVLPACLPDGSPNGCEHCGECGGEAEADGRNAPVLRCPAQWDTGASRTCVSENVISSLNLTPIGKQNLITPNGRQDRFTYLCHIVLPNRQRVTDMVVVGSEIGLGGIDVLLGMDVIGLGDFIVSNYQGNSAFTFRFPSSHCYDFTRSDYLGDDPPP